MCRSPEARQSRNDELLDAIPLALQDTRGEGVGGIGWREAIEPEGSVQFLAQRSALFFQFAPVVGVLDRTQCGDGTAFEVREEILAQHSGLRNWQHGTVRVSLNLAVRHPDCCQKQ